MTSETRIPKAEITGLYGVMLKRFSKKLLGDVAEPAEVMWHHRQVLKDVMAFGPKVHKWSECDPNLKSFAHMAVASLVGCSWCLDFGYFQAHNEKLDVTKASQVPRWRESDVFTPLERDVMEYAEAMSQTRRRSQTSCRHGCSLLSARPRWSSSLRGSPTPTRSPAPTRRSASSRRASRRRARSRSPSRAGT